MEKINHELKGKTDGYLAQIEEHQKKLAPWTEKINAKKKAIDVKSSEKEILAERISSGTRAVEEAEKRLAAIEETYNKKVRFLEGKAYLILIPTRSPKANLFLERSKSYVRNSQKSKKPSRQVLH